MSLTSSGGWCVPGDAVSNRISVEFLTVRSLQALARANQLRGYSRLRRAQLVDALRRAGVTDVEVGPLDLSLPAVSVDRGGVRFTEESS